MSPAVAAGVGVVYASPVGEAEVRWVAPHAPLPGQVAISTTRTLISPGTELHYLDEAKRTGIARPLGYCACGAVEELGKGVSGLAVGDRVTAMGFGYAVHAERVCVPQRLCVRIPSGLHDRLAVFANLAATARHALERGRVTAGAQVVVVGLGLVGQLVARMAAAAGARVVGVDREPVRVEAAQHGHSIHAVCSSEGRFQDEVLRNLPGPAARIMFLCVRGEATDALQEAIIALDVRPDAVRYGRVVCVGRFDTRLAWSADLGDIDLVNSSRCGWGYRDVGYVHGGPAGTTPTDESSVDANLRVSLDMIADGRLRLDGLLTREYSLDSVREAYSGARTDPAQVGAQFVFRQESGSAPSAMARG